MKPKASNTCSTARIRPRRLDVPNPRPCVIAPHVIVWPVRLPRWIPLSANQHVVQRSRNRNPPRSLRLGLRAREPKFIPRPVDLMPLEAKEFLLATPGLQRRDHDISQVRSPATVIERADAAILVAIEDLVAR